MPRLLVQSIATGRFLVPALEFPHSPEWVISLRETGGGVLSDYEVACALVEEYSEIDDICIIVDLDKIGTVNDYPI